MAILKEEYIKKFKRCILEYTGGFDSTIDEAGEDDAMQDMGGDPNMMGDEGMQPNADPNAMGGEPMDPNAMGGDPNMANGEGGVEGFEPEGANPDAPMDGMGGDPNMMGDEGMQPNADPNMMGSEPMQPGDEVIDVDDLTRSQETAEKKIDKMNHKFEELMGAISKLVKQNDEREKSTAEAIAASEKRMEDELNKRIPTPQQRMSMRSTKSYPYSMSPNEYINNHAPSNYSDADDNNGIDDVQYQITKGDIDNFTDYNSIAKELDIDHQDLHSILGF